MRFSSAILAAFLCLCAQTALALPSNLHPTLHYGWAQNAGWLNGSPFGYTDEGVQVSPLTVSGYGWGQNIGWVNFGDSTPADGLRYSNASAADCGVNMDWRGNLSGFAWSQNAGWITFGWAVPNDSNRARFNNTTFRFEGYAWSQNLGWMNLSGDWLRTDGLVGYADSDADGLPDTWEIVQKGNLTSWNAATDFDGDGLADGWEFTYLRALGESNGTQDSDGDGFTDLVEYIAGTNPANAASPGPWPTPPPSSTIDENANFAWAQNLGWINARHNQPAAPAGIVVNFYHLRGTAWAQNAGWLDFGDGTPRDGLRYSNTQANDCGVNVDCELNLSGYAWAQNFGWVNFGWAAPSDANRPRVNNSGTNHLFSGYAWAQNAGWINLGTLNNNVVANYVDIDFDGLPDQFEFALSASINVLDGTANTDGDGLPDAWEFAYFRALNITNGSGDFDQDGSSDAYEFAHGTNPRDPFSLPPPLGSSIASAGKYVWGQNVGWLNLRHDRPQSPSGVTVREYFLSGTAWGQNIGWLDLGDGSPANGIRYTNTAANDWGVNHDGAGNLSGHAWAQNIGWVNFGWGFAGVHAQRARVNLATGEFTGYAWAQNAGWVNLATGALTQSIGITDADADGLDDAWERENFNNLTAANAITDHDGDGQNDLAEFTSATDPRDPASALRITAHSINALRTIETLTYTSSPARQYRVSRSPDLLTWMPSPAGWLVGQLGTTTANEFLGAPADKYFFRVTAKRPLEP